MGVISHTLFQVCFSCTILREVEYPAGGKLRRIYSNHEGCGLRHSAGYIFSGFYDYCGSLSGGTGSSAENIAAPCSFYPSSMSGGILCKFNSILRLSEHEVSTTQH